MQTLQYDKTTKKLKCFVHSQPNMATTVCTSAYTPTLITLDLAIPFVQDDYSNTTSVLDTFDSIWLDTCVIVIMLAHYNMQFPS